MSALTRSVSRVVTLLMPQRLLKGLLNRVKRFLQHPDASLRLVRADHYLAVLLGQFRVGIPPPCIADFRSSIS